MKKNRTDYYGNLGDIWLYSESKQIYRAIRFFPNGDEKMYSFPASDLPKWIRKLEVPLSWPKQVYFRDHFPTTLEDIQKRFETSQTTKRQKVKLA